MRKIILLLSLVFFISIVNAATITYNFSSVFEGNNTFAFRDNFGIDSPPPANSILPFSDTLVDITSQSELDLSDDTTYSFNCGSTGSGPNSDCDVISTNVSENGRIELAGGGESIPKLSLNAKVLFPSNTELKLYVIVAAFTILIKNTKLNSSIIFLIFI